MNNAESHKKDTSSDEYYPPRHWSHEMGLAPRTLEEKQAEDRQIFDEVAKTRSMTNDELSHARGFAAELERRRRTSWGRFKHLLGNVGIGVFVIFIIAGCTYFLWEDSPYNFLNTEHSQERIGSGDVASVQPPTEKILGDCSCKVTGGDCSNASFIPAFATHSTMQ